MITERTLKKWRTDALRMYEITAGTSEYGAYIVTLSERILRLTQELLDQHLIRKEKKRND